MYVYVAIWRSTYYSSVTCWFPRGFYSLNDKTSYHKIPKPRYWIFKLWYRSVIWQAPRQHKAPQQHCYWDVQHCYWDARQISEQSDKSKSTFCGCEILRDLGVMTACRLVNKGPELGRFSVASDDCMVFIQISWSIWYKWNTYLNLVVLSICRIMFNMNIGQWNIGLSNADTFIVDIHSTDTWRNDNVIVASKRRHHVVLTL